MGSQKHGLTDIMTDKLTNVMIDTKFSLAKSKASKIRHGISAAWDCSNSIYFLNYHPKNCNCPQICFSSIGGDGIGAKDPRQS